MGITYVCEPGEDWEVLGAVAELGRSRKHSHLAAAYYLKKEGLHVSELSRRLGIEGSVQIRSIYGRRLIDRAVREISKRLLEGRPPLRNFPCLRPPSNWATYRLGRKLGKLLAQFRYDLKGVNEGLARSGFKLFDCR